MMLNAVAVLLDRLTAVCTLPQIHALVHDLLDEQCWLPQLQLACS